MFDLENFTCFPAQQFQSLDQYDRAFNVVVAKVSYDLSIDPKSGISEILFAENQSPIIFSDQYYDDSYENSTRLESDLVLYKPKLDLVVNAIAYAPDTRPSKQFVATVKIGDYHKSIAVTGPRNWIREAFGWSLSEASPITSLPIRYEYAYGGKTSEEADSATSLFNPVGRGFYSSEELSRTSVRTLQAHQIYNPQKPILTPFEAHSPEGFGFFSRYFSDRIRFTGTSDKEWIQKRAPLLPKDFSMQYWNGAHPELQLPHLKHNHVYDITLTGMVPSFVAPAQKISFPLPVETIFALIYTTENIAITRDLILDTIIIDVEHKRVNCSYRIALPEELEIDQCQLRFIARHDRSRQMSLYHQKKDIEIIPIPPSLIEA